MPEPLFSLSLYTVVAPVATSAILQFSVQVVGSHLLFGLGNLLRPAIPGYPALFTLDGEQPGLGETPLERKLEFVFFAW